MSFEWHPRYHQDALDGMLMLTLEERGAYNTILDLIYNRQAPVPDDERWIAGWLGCSVKKWRLLRATLLVKGKLVACEHQNQPALMNERARLEIESASTRRRVAAESGANGGRKRAQKEAERNKNKGLGQAALEGSLKLKTETETIGSVSKDTGGEPPSDIDGATWTSAVTLLKAQADMPEKQARSFFGRLLSENGLEARDLLPAVTQAVVNRTQDPASYLRRSAAGISKRRAQGPPKRVAFV